MKIANMLIAIMHIFRLPQTDLLELNLPPLSILRDNAITRKYLLVGVSIHGVHFCNTEIDFWIFIVQYNIGIMQQNIVCFTTNWSTQYGLVSKARKGSIY